MKTKKKTVLTAVSVILALSVVIGSTIAYLMDVSDPVRNEFSKNNVEVSLVETTDGYDIIPGTEEAKDPKVSGKATLPSYVFVKVEDETDDLVDYEIAQGWTLVPGTDGVYYREVADGDFGPFSVLKDDKVKYSEDITSEDVKAAGDDLSLTFTAYAIQKAPFNDPAVAWSQIQPSASLTDLDPENIGNVTDQDSSWTGKLDMAVNFATSDTADSVEGKDYQDYKVDFMLSFNKAIPDGSKVHLFGNYGTYGWLGDDLAAGGKASLAANEELAVMSDWFLPAIGMGDGQITYNDVVTLIKSFDCGVAVDDEDLKEGLVATLKLVMIDDKGAVQVIDSSTYKF